MKRARHKQEKVFMETLSGMGNAVGEYVGGGQGDLEISTEAPEPADLDLDVVDADWPGIDDQSMDEDEDAPSSVFL